MKRHNKFGIYPTFEAGQMWVVCKDCKWKWLFDAGEALGNINAQSSLHTLDMARKVLANDEHS